MSNSNSSTTQYKIKKEELVLLKSKYQNRTFAEELDYLESLGDTFASTLSVVDYSKGISQSEVASRRAQYCSNAKHEPKSWLGLIARKIAEQLGDIRLKAILILSIVSILINIAVKGFYPPNWYEKYFTLFAAILYTFYRAFVQEVCEFCLNKRILELNGRVFVWRDGELINVDKSELVTGDIVQITSGMKIPADMLLIEVSLSCNITIDETIILGKLVQYQNDYCLTVSNKEMKSLPMAISGEGKAIVLLVDEPSRSERVKSFLQDEGNFSGLHMKFDNVAQDIGKTGLGAAAIIFLVLAIKFFIERFKTDTLSEGSQYVQFIDFLMATVTIIIVAIPESLSHAVTSIMTYSIYRMKYRAIGVRKLKDLEYLGAVNSICCSINGSTEDYKALKDAGIRLRIVTEDDKTSVETITNQLASIESSSQENAYITGNEFLELVGDIVCKRCKTKDCDCPTNNQTARKSRREIRVDEIANFSAFGRVYNQLHVLTTFSSEAKTALVFGLKQKGETVAISGDGTDDVLALRKADVGLALRFSSEAVKEAAGIVLLDNKLNTLVEAVIWSRNIHDNTRKYLQYQLTAIIVVVSINLVSAFTCSKPLLSPAQLIWTMFKQSLGQALFQFVLLMGIAYSVPDSKNLHAQQSSAVHMTFLMCQILNLLNCRKIHGEINVFSDISRWFLLFEILLFIVFVGTHYLMMGLFHSLVWTFFASLTLIWPVIMKLYIKTRQASKTHEKTE